MNRIESTIKDIFNQALIPTKHNSCLKRFKQIIEKNQPLKNDLNNFMIDLIKKIMVVDSNLNQVNSFLDFISKLSTYLYFKDTTNNNNNNSIDSKSTFLYILMFDLFKWTKSQNKDIRTRSCQLLRDILSCLKNNNNEIDDILFDKSVNKLGKRLYDKFIQVRVMAVHAIVHLQTTEKDDQATLLLLDVLDNDSSSDVRKAIIQNMAITYVTLPKVISRVRDSDPSIRKTTFNFLSKRVKLELIDKVETRIFIISGLLDTNESVKKACKEMICDGWMEKLGNDFEKLLSLFDVENNIQHCERLLNCIFQEGIYPNNDFNLETCQSKESLFCWKMFLNFIKNNNNNVLDEIEIDRITPKPFDLIDCIEKLDIDQSFQLTQLFEMIDFLDNHDPIFRDKCSKIFEKSLLSLDLDIPTKKVILSTLRSLYKGRRNDYKSIILPILSDLGDPIEGEEESLEASNTRTTHTLIIVSEFLEHAHPTFDKVEIQGLYHYILQSLKIVDVENIMQLGIKCASLYFNLDTENNCKKDWNLILLFINQNNLINVKIEAIAACFDIILSKPSEDTVDFCSKFIKTIKAILNIDKENHDIDPEYLNIVFKGLCKLYYSEYWTNQEDFNQLAIIFFYPNLFPIVQSTFAEFNKSFVHKSKGCMSMFTNSFESVMVEYFHIHQFSSSEDQKKKIQYITNYYITAIKPKYQLQEIVVSELISNLLIEMLKLICYFSKFENIQSLCESIKFFYVVDDQIILAKLILYTDIAIQKSKKYKKSVTILNQFKKDILHKIDKSKYIEPTENDIDQVKKDISKFTKHLNIYLEKRTNEESDESSSNEEDEEEEVEEEEEYEEVEEEVEEEKVPEVIVIDDDDEDYNEIKVEKDDKYKSNVKIEENEDVEFEWVSSPEPTIKNNNKSTNINYNTSSINNNIKDEKMKDILDDDIKTKERPNKKQKTDCIIM